MPRLVSWRVIRILLLAIALKYLLSHPMEPTSPFHENLGSDARLSYSCPNHTLILTAHPDDECMFFAPTIISLVTRGCEVSALCLSTGDSDGLGETRTDELYASYYMLGLNEESVHILDHPDLRDNITYEWKSSTIAEVLEVYVSTLGIDTILTFDGQGISGHPNHIALPRGALDFAHANADLSLSIYTLKTVPILKKYCSVLGPLLLKLYRNLMEIVRPSALRATDTFISGHWGYATALAAMRQHSSQLVWFRWLYVLTSRYMWINEWTAICPVNAG